MEDLYIVRLYDYFDRIWIDISQPLSKDDAKLLWDKETDNGRKMTKFEDGDYYKIFPANTEMLFTSEFMENDEDED